MKLPVSCPIISTILLTLEEKHRLVETIVIMQLYSNNYFYTPFLQKKKADRKNEQNYHGSKQDLTS